MDEGNIGIIILAAGASSRMGTSKQLLVIDEQPLLRKTVNVAIASGLPDIIVVLGANESQHRKVIDNLPVDVTVNSGWEDGMGSSIKTGINFLLAKNKDSRGVIILVCDQPFLKADHIAELVSEYQRTKKSIVASMYADTYGVPVFFENKLFSQLLSMPDSEGAKQIIRKNREVMSSVNFPQGEIDLDTPEDFRKFTENNSL